MTNCLKLLFKYSVLLSLAACSTKTSLSSSAESGTSAVAVNLQQVYADFAKLSPAQVAASFDAIGKLNFTQFYNVLHNMSSNTSLSINGKILTGGLSQLENQRLQILALGNQFATVGDYLKSVGVTAATMTPSNYQASVERLLGVSGSSLSLAADFQPNGNCSQDQLNQLTAMTTPPAGETGATATIGQIIAAMNKAKDTDNSKYSSPDVTGTDDEEWVDSATKLYTVEAHSSLHSGQPSIDFWDLNSYHPKTDPSDDGTPVKGAGKLLKNCFTDQGN